MKSCDEIPNDMRKRRFPHYITRNSSQNHEEFLIILQHYHFVGSRKSSYIYV